jgi:hypothetical protein
MKFAFLILPAVIIAAPIPDGARTEPPRAAAVRAGLGVAAGGLALLAHAPSAAKAYGRRGGPFVDGASFGLAFDGKSTAPGPIDEMSEIAMRIGENSNGPEGRQ